MSLSVSRWRITQTYLAKVAFLFLMHSVSPTAIELTCLIESISTNNPRIEWKKIKNGIPSYVYFQNRIAGKPPASSPFFKTPRQPVFLKYCTQSSAESMVPWKNLALNSVFLHCEVTLCMWMSNCKVFFSPRSSLERGLGAQSSAQRASQHRDLQHQSVGHSRVPLRGGRHRWSKGLWWDTD